MNPCEVGRREEGLDDGEKTVDLLTSLFTRFCVGLDGGADALVILRNPVFQRMLLGLDHGPQVNLQMIRRPGGSMVEGVGGR